MLEDAVAHRAVPLSRLAEWTVMAAWLLALRARLLLPAGTTESAEAEQEAADLRRQLAKREAARRLADWLERRVQLGREVFARGAPEQEAAAEPAADVTTLLRACLTLLEVPPRERVYRPRPPALWRVPSAFDPSSLRSILLTLTQLKGLLETSVFCLQRIQGHFVAKLEPDVHFAFVLKITQASNEANLPVATQQITAPRTNNKRPVNYIQPAFIAM